MRLHPTRLQLPGYRGVVTAGRCACYAHRDTRGLAPNAFLSVAGGRTVVQIVLPLVMAPIKPRGRSYTFLNTGDGSFSLPHQHDRPNPNHNHCQRLPRRRSCLRPPKWPPCNPSATPPLRHSATRQPASITPHTPHRPPTMLTGPPKGPWTTKKAHGPPKRPI